MIELAIGVFVEMCLAILLYEEIKYAWRSIRDFRVKRQCDLYESIQYDKETMRTLNLLSDMPEEVKRLLQEEHEEKEEED